MTDPTEALALWTTPDMLELLNRQGWPEWNASMGGDGGTHIERLTPPREGKAWAGLCSCGLDDTIHARVALALLHDDSLKKIREWADAKDVTLNIATCGSVCTITTSDIDDQIRCIAEEDGYDETLVAARQAIEHE